MQTPSPSPETDKTPRGWQLLHSKLPKAAVRPLDKSVYGVSGLSDVNEGYLIQRLFASGLDWSWEIEDPEFLGTYEHTPRGKDYTLRYFMYGAHGRLIIEGRHFDGIGASDNTKLDAAAKGAATVAFKNATKMAAMWIELLLDGRAIDHIYEDREGRTVAQPTKPEGTEGEAAVQPPSSEPIASPAEAPSVPSAPQIEPYEVALANGQVVTLYRVRALTDVGERVLGPFNTLEEAQKAIETGELPEPAPTAEPAAEEKTKRRKGTRGIAPGMTPPAQPEAPAPTLEQQLEESVRQTSAGSAGETEGSGDITAESPAPSDEPFAVGEPAEAQNTMSADEARLHRIRELAVALKKLQHERKGERVPDEKGLAMEAGQALDAVCQRMFRKEFIALVGGEYQDILDYLESTWNEAQTRGAA